LIKSHLFAIADGKQCRLVPKKIIARHSLSVSAGNGWPHNACSTMLMPISCHFREALLATSLTHVSQLPRLLSLRIIPQLILPYNRKDKSFKQTAFLSEQCAVSKVPTVFEVQSFGLDTYPRSFYHSLTAQSIIRCSKSVQKFAGLPWGLNFNPHTHAIPIPMGIPIPTAALKIRR